MPALWTYRRLGRALPAAMVLVSSLTGGVAVAAPLPDALSQRMQQGVSACLDYYVDGTGIAALSKLGFSADTKGMSIELLPPEVPRKVRVTTLVEGRNGAECEVHATYVRHDTQKNAHGLTMALADARGFTPKVRHHYASRAKTILLRDTLSVFLKFRDRGNTMSIKFKLRSR